jgi:hypothetical protein
LMDESTRDLMAERLGPTSLGLVCHGKIKEGVDVMTTWI